MQSDVKSFNFFKFYKYVLNDFVNVMRTPLISFLTPQVQGQ